MTAARNVSGEPRPTAHSFDQINWQNAETETRIGALQEMVAILLNELEARATPPSLDAERLKRAMAMWAEESEIDLILPEDAEVVADEYARLTSKEERCARFRHDEHCAH